MIAWFILGWYGNLFFDGASDMGSFVSKLSPPHGMPRRPLSLLRMARFVAWCLLLTGVCWPATAQEPEPPAASGDFAELYEEWQALNVEIRGLRTQFALVDTDEERVERIRAMATALRRVDELLSPLVASAKAAYLADPSDHKAPIFLLNVAKAAFRSERLELAADTSQFLLTNGYKNPALRNLAGMALAELLRLDEAIAQFELAKEEGVIEPAGESFLAAVPAMMEELQPELDRRAKEAADDNLPRVEFQTTRGTIVVELFENEVPNTVAHFLNLVSEGFYDGLPFYQVDSQLGAVTGCPDGTGRSGSERRVLPEIDPSSDRQHVRGVLSMVGATGEPIDSKFLIVFHSAAAWHYNGKRTVFGRVIEGMDAASQLERVSPGVVVEGIESDRIESARVLRRRDHPYMFRSTRNLAAKNLREAIDAIVAKAPENEVLAKFNTALKLDPHLFDTYLTLGKYLITLERYSLAARRLARAVELHSEHSDAHFYLGLALIKIDRYAEAASEFQASLERNPDDARAIQNLGIAFAAQKMFDEAIEQYTRLLELKPDDARAREVLAGLKARRGAVNASP